MAHTDSCEQGFACNAYYKLYYYIKLFRKVKQFFKNTAPKFINSLSSLFAQFPFASLIRRKKHLFCFTKPENFPKIFYAAKNRTYTNTPRAICASKIVGMPNLKYQCRVLW